MHKREIMKLTGLVSREGYTLVPLSLYFKGSRVKTAKVKVGDKKLNREYVRIYKKFFTPKNCGAKVKVK